MRGGAPRADSGALSPGVRRVWLTPTRLALALAAVYTAAALFGREVDPELTATSYGHAPAGFGALQTLLVERDLGGARSLEAPQRLAPGSTVWWIEPRGVCDSRLSSTRRRSLLDVATWPALPWLEAGGTAVVVLEPLPAPAGGVGSAESDPIGAAPAEEHEDEEALGRPPCDAIAGFELPERIAIPGRAIEGALVARPRQLPLAALTGFRDAGDWWVAAGTSEHPFVLERRVGEGRLVVVADARFLRNAHLDAGDAAPLAVELARAYGAPRLDEREHGFLPAESAAHYLVRSEALPVFAGLALLGVAIGWRGAAWPARRLQDDMPPAPTLALFVDSLATLYARSRDHARQAERYRELTLARLRRHFRLPAEVSERALVERLARERRGEAKSLERLRETPPVTSAAELRGACRQLDEIFEEVTR